MSNSFAVVRRKRKKKILKDVKGFRGRVKNNGNLAITPRIKKYKNEYIGRKQRKRQHRSLWIMRINAAVRQYGLTYSTFMNKFNNQESNLNRKSLSEIAIHKPDLFKGIIDSVINKK